MQLPDELIHQVTRENANFDNHKSSLRGRITLVIFMVENNMVVNFLSINYKAPYNDIMGRDWIIPMKVFTSTRF